MPCGQNGRVDQLCTSRTGPIAPLQIHSQSVGGRLLARAAEHVRGGARLAGGPDHEPRLVHHVGERLVRTITCLPARSPASETVAWRWSGVMQ